MPNLFELDELYWFDVVSLFVDAYNRFHMVVFEFRLLNPKREFPLGLVDFL